MAGPRMTPNDLEKRVRILEQRFAAHSAESEERNRRVDEQFKRNEREYLAINENINELKIDIKLIVVNATKMLEQQNAMKNRIAMMIFSASGIVSVVVAAVQFLFRDTG